MSRIYLNESMPVVMSTPFFILHLRPRVERASIHRSAYLHNPHPPSSSNPPIKLYHPPLPTPPPKLPLQPLNPNPLPLRKRPQRQRQRKHARREYQSQIQRQHEPRPILQPGLLLKLDEDEGRDDHDGCRVEDA